MHVRYAAPILALALVLLLAAHAGACIWDYDTLRMEQRQFPDALELMTGRFLRHGEAFYRWRIADREPRLAAAPDDLALYDDLAVAHEKTGDRSKAIEIMLAKAARKEGLYETEANLGTFYIHAGELEKGLVHVRRAIAINPDAHFGRELQQVRLVEYVLTKRVDGKLPLPMDTKVGLSGKRGFAAFVLADRDDADGERAQAIEAAVQGVLGMMRFGRHDAPVLLEALADLLLTGAAHGYDASARRLAARALLAASYGVEGDARAAYRTMAGGALASQTVGPHSTESLTLEQVEAKFETERREAAAWYAGVLADEETWIRTGENPEARFDEKYFGVGADEETASATRIPWATIGIVVGVLAVLNTLLMLAMRRRRHAAAARRADRVRRRGARPAR